MLLSFILALSLTAGNGNPTKDTTAAGEMKIGIYVAPDLQHTTDECYTAIREAHIDLIQDISLWLPVKDKINMLEMAGRHGIEMFVADERVNGSDTAAAAMVADYSRLKATAGYYVQDEPVLKDLPGVARKYQRLLRLDSTKVPHVNLLPIYATGALPGIDYASEYVEKWIQLVGADRLRYLSFDNYPFMTDSTLREGPYYRNLDIIRRIGLKYHVRTSAYLQSIGTSTGLRRPGANDLRYNVYTNLAYGIKLPVWFTYWTPLGGSTEQFTNAVVDTSGKKTDLYEPFKALNSAIKAIGRTLIQLDAKEVYHTGASVPEGTVRIPAGFVVTPEGPENDLLISLFVRPEDGKQYVMIVNRSLKDSVHPVFRVSPAIRAVKRISAISGSEERCSYRKNRLTDTFLPGEGRLYALY